MELVEPIKSDNTDDLATLFDKTYSERVLSQNKMSSRAKVFLSVMPASRLQIGSFWLIPSVTPH